jgi:hypothetical protein
MSTLAPVVLILHSGKGRCGSERRVPVTKTSSAFRWFPQLRRHLGRSQACWRSSCLHYPPGAGRDKISQ